MFQIGNEKVWCGDFHGQWCEGPETLPLNLAALSVCGHDFSLFNTGDTSPTGPFCTLVRQLEVPFLVLPYGRELMYSWSHLMVGGLDPNAEVPGVSNPDFVAVLKELRQQCSFISIAHPYPPFLKHLDYLLDEHLVDSVAFLEASRPEYLQWYQERLATGKPMPIVAELDFHVPNGRRQGLIHYPTAAAAQADLPPVAKRHTLVFAEELTTEAIYAAVRAGRTCVDLDGQLFGSPELVQKLEKHGYLQQKAEALKAREALRFQLADGVAPLEGEPVNLQVTDGTKEWQCTLQPTVNPAGLERFYVPVTANGQCRCVEVASTQQARLLPGYAADGTGMVTVEVRNNSTKHAAEGEFTLQAGEKHFTQCYTAIAPGECRHFQCPVEKELLQQEPPQKTTLAFVPKDMAPRRQQRSLICTAVPHVNHPTTEDWQALPPMILARPDQLETQWVDKWSGPEDSSAKVRLLWNDQALLLQAEIVDTVLSATQNPKQLFMGDALQIGIIPGDTHPTSPFDFYHFIATRGGQPNDDEFCMVCNLPAGDTANPMGKVPCRLPSQGYRLNHLGGNRSILEIAFPWTMLPLIDPRAGSRFMLHMVLWDNDGDGLKASIHWPHAKTSWYLPDDQSWAGAQLL